ncbi:MAG: dihydroneopterin aldolase [Verrucomicrobiota bacterium]|jgi:dihydroneopterin aldolase
MTGKIHLQNMVFYGYHGNLAEENVLGQRFLIDVVLTLDVTEAAQSDRLDATVDYQRVYNICRQIVEKERMRLLEALANRLIDAVLEACPRVSRMDVVVKKPSAPLGGALDYVALETGKDRDTRLPRPGQ